MNKSELIIKLLEGKMHELDKEALAVLGKEHSFDDYIEIVNQVTFLDELIDEIKRI